MTSQNPPRGSGDTSQDPPRGSGDTREDGDPDPTPTATPWEEYVAAAQSLDAMRREAAAADTAAVAEARAARTALAAVSEQLGQQRARLTARAAGAGVAVPPLEPSAAERAAVAATAAGDPAAAVRQSQRLIASADAELAGTRGWWPLGRGWLRGGLLVGALLGAVAALLTCATLALLLVRWLD